jgi:hypothetical protein
MALTRDGKRVDGFIAELAGAVTAATDVRLLLLLLLMAVVVVLPVRYEDRQ